MTAEVGGCYLYLFRWLQSEYTPLHLALQDLHDENLEFTKLLLGEIRQMSIDAKTSIFTPRENWVSGSTCSEYRVQGLELT